MKGFLILFQPLCIMRKYSTRTLTSIALAGGFPARSDTVADDREPQIIYLYIFVVHFF